ARGASARRAADTGPLRERRRRGAVLRGLSARVARRLAPARTHGGDAVRRRAHAAGAPRAGRPRPVRARMTIAVLRAGPATTVQDHGRPGLAHLGVPPSGAADRAALDAGNALVGNPPGAAALEATLAGPALRFRAPALVALTGAETSAVGSG